MSADYASEANSRIDEVRDLKAKADEKDRAWIKSLIEKNNPTCRMCGQKYFYSDEIDRCPACLVLCQSCHERPATRCETKTLVANDKPVADATVRVCDECDATDAAWDLLFREAMLANRDD